MVWIESYSNSAKQQIYIDKLSKRSVSDQNPIQSLTKGTLVQPLHMAVRESLETISGMNYKWLQTAWEFAAKTVANEKQCQKAMQRPVWAVIVAII